MATVFKPPRKRNTQALKEQAEMMRRTKLGAVASSSGSNEPVEPSRSSEDTDEKLAASTADRKLR